MFKKNTPIIDPLYCRSRNFKITLAKLSGHAAIVNQMNVLTACIGSNTNSLNCNLQKFPWLL